MSSIVGNVENKVFRDLSKEKRHKLLEKGTVETKVFVTGGLRTARAMVKALGVVDGIGLARPLCAEPNLPKDILEGRVKTGAVVLKIDNKDYGLTEIVAEMQIQ
ncbi:hypothetical protein B0J13DRAFT_630337 [Dactylonectria estremocensis]|uniref:Uncharacterized protein n=1 Tax=Dactylonectria estremocensis TaxID=1079267 RepID=A0A9P9DC40_9HYPO|nr:hypothetical protein B0J13DRAFT_630337 [Dactylonectria estremocensis]